jgi:hypothetical protein
LIRSAGLPSLAAVSSTAGAQRFLSWEGRPAVSIGRVHSERTPPTHEPQHATVFTSIKGPRQRATSPTDSLRCCHRSGSDGCARRGGGEGTPGSIERSHTAIADDPLEFDHDYDADDHAADDDRADHHHNSLVGRGLFTLHHAEYGDAHHPGPDNDHHLPSDHDDDPPRGDLGRDVEMSIPATDL